MWESQLFVWLFNRNVTSELKTNKKIQVTPSELISPVSFSLSRNRKNLNCKNFISGSPHDVVQMNAKYVYVKAHELGFKYQKQHSYVRLNRLSKSLGN